MAQASAQVQQSGLQWREAVVKVDTNTFMRVQYLYNQEVSDYNTLANLVRTREILGKAWKIDAREYTGQAGVGYANTENAQNLAAGLLENASAHEVVSKSNNIRTVTDAQREYFQAAFGLTSAGVQLGRSPRDEDASARFNEAALRLGRATEAVIEEEREFARSRERRRAREEETSQPVAEAPPEAVSTAVSQKRAAEALPKTKEKSAEPAVTLESVPVREEAPATAHTFAFNTGIVDERDPRQINYDVEIRWKEGYVPIGTYDLSDSSSVDRFIFDNAAGISSGTIVGFLGNNIDAWTLNRELFQGSAFAAEYARRVYREVEGEVNGQRVCLYVPRQWKNISFEDLSADLQAERNKFGVLAVGIGERGRESIAWSFASEPTDLMALLERRTRPEGGEVAQA